jgi:hypothetical protein
MTLIERIKSWFSVWRLSMGERFAFCHCEKKSGINSRGYATALIKESSLFVRSRVIRKIC